MAHRDDRCGVQALATQRDDQRSGQYAASQYLVKMSQTEVTLVEPMASDS